MSAVCAHCDFYDAEPDSAYCDYCLKECSQCGVDTPYEVCEECQLANRDARREELERVGELEDAERWEESHEGA